MAVYLEGQQVDTIDTAGQQAIETVYEDVRVDDGQLTLRMADLGGSDVNVVLNGLVVQWLAEEQSGPYVVEVTRGGSASDPLDRLRLRFNETIDASTFTLSDVVSLTGPQGAITPTLLTPVNETEFALTFPTQTVAGTYQIVVGPEIEDLTGNAMDQDQDGLMGEAIEDRFTGEIILVPVEDRRFDFGPSYAPLEAGYVSVNVSTVYSGALGYGFQAGVLGEVDRGTGTDLDRDLVYGRELTFAVDLPNAIYRVTLTTGDRHGFQHDQMAVYLEGQQVDTIDTAGQQVIETVYEDVRVDDGQLTLRMADLGGSDVNVVLNGLVVQWLRPAPSASGSSLLLSSAEPWLRDLFNPTPPNCSSSADGFSVPRSDTPIRSNSSVAASFVPTSRRAEDYRSAPLRVFDRHPLAVDLALMELFGPLP
jgi:anti-anti-sigma regulatory factor